MMNGLLVTMTLLVPLLLGLQVYESLNDCLHPFVEKLKSNVPICMPVQNWRY